MTDDSAYGAWSGQIYRDLGRSAGIKTNHYATVACDGGFWNIYSSEESRVVRLLAMTYIVGGGVSMQIIHLYYL